MVQSEVMRQAETIEVLVVDDNDALRNSVIALIKSAGYVVGEAWDADSAIEAVRTNNVKTMVLDVRMPGGGGLAVLEALHDSPPVILMTAYVLDDAVRDWVGPRIFMLLVKPFHPRRLLNAVVAAIGPPESRIGQYPNEGKVSSAE